MLCDVCGPKTEKGQPLSGILDVRIRGEVSNLADPLDLLPVERSYFPAIPVGNTPLWAPQRLRKKLGLKNLYIKDDTCNPTGSLKDRASFLVAAFARKHGIGEISLASTGNAGSSMAGVGAAAGLNVTLFLPKAAPPAKMIQALQYGARVLAVDGNYDKAYELSAEWARQTGGLSRNTGFNPLTIEGKKTVALEIYKDLGRAPDAVFVPTGDGVIISGVYKGFQDLYDLGLIQVFPCIYAVQARGSTAIARAFESGRFEVRTGDTIADSISVDTPACGLRILQHLRKHKGKCVVVSDQQILKAQLELASSTGLFAEPAAAASYAGLLQEREALDKDAMIVILATGHGLKDPESARQRIKLPDMAIGSLSDIR